VDGGTGQSYVGTWTGLGRNLQATLSERLGGRKRKPAQRDSGETEVATGYGRALAMHSRSTNHLKTAPGSR
jgi:hypothetical protein